MLMKADFRYLIFVNYQVDSELLEPRVPSGVHLQLLNGKAYVSIVAFLFENLEIQGLPAPLHQQFEEVNLRFYVHQKQEREEKPGVVFIREIVPKTLVTAAARILFNENYITLRMGHVMDVQPGQLNTVEYSWETDRKSFVRASFQNKWHYPEPNSPEYFFITRPFGYTRVGEKRTNQIAMKHPLWRVCPVLDFAAEYDIPSVFGVEFVPFLTLKPASVFIAEGSPIMMKS